ncbi:hypothetical protein [Spiroplasma endosymbiont of Villa modesta]
MDEKEKQKAEEILKKMAEREAADIRERDRQRREASTSKSQSSSSKSQKM